MLCLEGGLLQRIYCFRNCTHELTWPQLTLSRVSRLGLRLLPNCSSDILDFMSCLLTKWEKTVPFDKVFSRSCSNLVKINTSVSNGRDWWLIDERANWVKLPFALSGAALMFTSTTQKWLKWVSDWSSGQFSTVKFHLPHTARPQSSTDLPPASITVFSSFVCQGKG